MSENYLNHWNIDAYISMIEKAANEICAYNPPKGESARPFSKKIPALDFNFGSCGNNYFDAPNRLLVIGRACGNYTEKSEEIVISYDPDAEKTTFNKTNLINSIQQELKHDFSWLGNKVQRTGKKDRLEEQTPYFYLVKKVEQALNGDKENEWRENIALINIYKFIPHGGGNPSVGLVRAQKNNTFSEILRMQMKEFAPTHILMIVGQDNEYWYPKTYREVIEGYSKSSNVKVAIVDRPEVRKKIIRDGITLTNLENIHKVIESEFRVKIF